MMRERPFPHGQPNHGGMKKQQGNRVAIAMYPFIGLSTPTQYLK